MARTLASLLGSGVGFSHGNITPWIKRFGAMARDTPKVGEARTGHSDQMKVPEYRHLELLVSLREELERTRLELANKNQTIAEIQVKSGGSCGRTESELIDPKNVVWVFGSGRSGSTWLSSMMEDLTGHTLWGEPWVGYLFGAFYYHWVDERKHKNPQFIMGSHRESWLKSIRTFVMNAANATFSGLGDEYLVIKEPNGSVGAPLLMEAMPESRMVLLVRDPRDVVASYADARKQGGWHYEKNKGGKSKGFESSPEVDPVGFAEERARALLRQMGNAKRAYDAHQGRKTLISYEELRSHTMDAMERLYYALDIPVDREELAEVVKKHSWDRIPEEKKGERKFYRKATPGCWLEDLTTEQVEAVERVTAPLLKELRLYETSDRRFS